MLSRTFRVKEKVQVLDAVTSNWKSAVILSLISDWAVKIKWSDWPGSAISSVPENSQENAAAWNKRKLHERNDSCAISRRRNSRKEKLSFNLRRLHRDSMVFFEHAGSVKKGIVIINNPFVSQCTVRSVYKPQDTAGNGPSCSGSLYVRYSELREESQGESRKRVDGESLPDDFLKFGITDAEKSIPKQKPSEPKAKKTNKKQKPQEDILSRLNYIELPVIDIRLKFAPCINGVKQVKLSFN